jgi:hypothetical protein
MVEIGIPPHVVNRVLNHALDPITAAYDHHTYRNEIGEALARWAAELERIVEQRPSVVALTR